MKVLVCGRVAAAAGLALAALVGGSIAALSNSGAAPEIWPDATAAMQASAEPDRARLASAGDFGAASRLQFAHAVPGAAPLAVAAPPAASEPFGVAATSERDQASREWQRLTREIRRDAKIVEACRIAPNDCPSAAALRLLAILREAGQYAGRARIGLINRAINLAVRPVSDLVQHGIEDVWSSPLATLASGQGDCEDYAILKFLALMQAGIAADDLRLVVMRDIRRRIDHAVLSVRITDRWLILDNRHHVMVEDVLLRHYVPLLVLGLDAPAPIATAAGGPPSKLQP
jgi:predicted transglutaminase-like cysteine proteinase